MTNLSVSRRALLRGGAVASAGLMIGFLVTPTGRRMVLGAEKVFQPNAFLRISPSGDVTAIISPSEMGQGIHTALAMVLAEELDADWKSIKVEAAPVNPGVYGNKILNGLQTTEASVSMKAFYMSTRHAAAAARLMLIRAAAAEWNVQPVHCTTKESAVKGPNGQTLSYGALVASAAKLPLPKESEIQLKDGRNSNIVGRPMPQIDLNDKITGKPIYGIDVRLPGMLTAVVARIPAVGAKVKSFNGSELRRLPGIREVVEIPSGIAIIGTDYWSAQNAKQELRNEWNLNGIERFSSKELEDKHLALVKLPGKIAGKRGDFDDALKRAKKFVRAEYLIPNIAHAPMEPLNCTIDASSTPIKIWVGTQDQELQQSLVAKIFRQPLEQVEINTLRMGGGFGRRGSPDGDFVVETAEIVKAARHLKAPIRNIWAREDDIRGGFYRPMAANELIGVFDDEDDLVGLRYRIVARSPNDGTQFGFLVSDGIDASDVAGARDLPYGMPNLSVELNSPTFGPTVQWLRSVGGTNVAFAIESFMDELAAYVKADPIEFRRRLLAKQDGNQRLLHVLELVAEKAGWGNPLGPGRGRGVAVHDFWGTKVAQVAEVSVSKGKLVVERITCAIDCGFVVNPDGVRAQVEGAIVFGLSAALYGKISFADGLPEQSNFHDYPILRMDACPEIEVHIVPSQEAPGGVGEVAVPHVAPAVCNAIYAAVGKRIRQLPISDALPSV